MPGRIRLACMCCDREDFDGIDKLPDDWGDHLLTKTHAAVNEKGVDYCSATCSKLAANGQ